MKDFGNAQIDQIWDEKYSQELIQEIRGPILNQNKNLLLKMKLQNQGLKS